MIQTYELYLRTLPTVLVTFKSGQCRDSFTNLTFIIKSISVRLFVQIVMYLHVGVCVCVCTRVNLAPKIFWYTFINHHDVFVTIRQRVSKCIVSQCFSAVRQKKPINPDTSINLV